MIPYAGRHYAQMYMRRKRIKCGFKVCALHVLKVYVFKLKVYVRKENKILWIYTLGTRVILDLIKCFGNPIKHKSNVENFFNSLYLLEEMGSW